MSWLFAEREPFASWRLLLQRLPESDAAVIDGQKGLLDAIRCLCPLAKIKRCIVHIDIEGLLSTRNGYWSQSIWLKKKSKKPPRNVT